MEIYVDKEGYCEYYRELERLKQLSLSIATSGTKEYESAIGDGWHDNFAFEESMRESNKIAMRINKMLEEEKHLKVVERTTNNLIDIGDILLIKVIYDKDDIEEYTIKLTGKYLPNTNNEIKEISLNSPIGRSIYQKDITDNNIYYCVNDKKINIKIIRRI